MKILIDTNLPITYITSRETDPDKESVNKVMELCAYDDVEGFLAFHSVSNMWFVMTHIKDRNTGAAVFTKSEVRENIIDLCKIITVVGADTEAVIDALENDKFPDFEDCLQEKCAITAGADYIVTNNTKDYRDSLIPAITPKEFLKFFNDQE